MNKAVKRVLIAESDIEGKLKELGEKISRCYGDEEVVVISILKGALVFTADLIRRLECDVVLDSMMVSIYGSGPYSSGKIKIVQDCREDLKGRNVLVVDDIIDTGNTLAQLCEFLKTREPKSLRTCVFLDKPSRRTVEYTPDFSGYEIPDAFVIGYGLDYDGKYRQLPYVAEIKEEFVK